MRPRKIKILEKPNKVIFWEIKVPGNIPVLLYAVYIDKEFGN